MKLPSKVKIGGFTYTIESIADLNFNGDAAYGFCDLDKQKIAIHNKCTLERTQQVLLHEIMHAVLNAVHLSAANLKNGEIEEYIITHSAPLLVEVLKNNPKVASYLTHKGN